MTFTTESVATAAAIASDLETAGLSTEVPSPALFGEGRRVTTSAPRIEALRLPGGAVPVSLQALHRGIELLQRIVSGLPFARGRLVQTGVVSAAGTFSVRHGLGRVPSGVLVLDHVRASGATGAASIYRRAGDSASATDITLYTSATISNAQLWVW